SLILLDPTPLIPIHLDPASSCPADPDPSCSHFISLPLALRISIPLPPSHSSMLCFFLLLPSSSMIILILLSPSSIHRCSSRPCERCRPCGRVVMPAVFYHPAPTPPLMTAPYLAPRFG